MPRLRRVIVSEEDRLKKITEETCAVIKVAMVRQGVKYSMNLADMIGMDRSTFYKKIQTGTWTQRDLIKIVAALKIQPEEALGMLGLRLNCGKGA